MTDTPAGNQASAGGSSATGPAPTGSAPTGPAPTGGGTAGGPAPSPAPAAPTPPNDLAVAVPLALQLGWAMMVLFGPFDPSPPVVSDRLPTEHELAKSQRIAVELARLACLVDQLNAQLLMAAPLPAPGSAQLAKADADRLVDDGARQAVLLEYNEELLETLACADRQVGLAYQLGRSLRSTANPPAPAGQTGESLASVRTVLDRERIVRLQGWLTTLGSHLAGDAAAVVAASLGRWCSWGQTVIGTDGRAALGQPAAQIDFAKEVWSDLLQQGDVWLNLLIGAEATSGLLTPESFVAAGEAALSRTTRIVRSVVLHNWIALLVVAVALVAVLYASFRYLGGAAKVWTEIVSIAGALGVTAKGISSRVEQLSSAAERPIYHAAEIDAMAWGATTLPNEDLIDPKLVRTLRSKGIRKAVPLGRA